MGRVLVVLTGCIVAAVLWTTASAADTRARSCTGVVVKPGARLQAVIAARRPGTTFCLAAGKYRLSAPLVPKSNDVLDGGGHAVLDGSRDITRRFAKTGPVWIAAGQTQSFAYPGGQCAHATPLCNEADDVFLDGKPLARVGSVAAVRPGRFYFDHANAQIVIGDNPARHRVEAAVSPSAVQGYGSGAESVTIRGLVVQHFALTGIQCRGDSWTVTSSLVRWNHGDGLQDCATVTHSRLSDNGKDGYVFGGHIGSSEGPYTFSYNTVDRNNYAGFDANWEAGGAKFMQMAHLTVSHNDVYANNGNGLWTDWGNQYVTYEANRISRNSMSGILHEASYDAVISGNTITGNGAPCTSTLCNSGIMTDDSQNVSVVGNTLTRNANGIGITQIARGSTALGPLVTRNISVHDNVLVNTGATGLVQWDSDGSYYTSLGNRFAGNRYVECRSNPFVWQSPKDPNSYAYLSWSQWQATGNDATGSRRCG